MLTHAGKNIVLIYIPEVEAHEKPVYIKSKGLEKGAFRRIGPTDQLCTREDIEYLYQGRFQKKYDETILENTSLEDIDSDALKIYRRMREEVNKNAEELKYSDEELLQSLSVLRPSKGMKFLNVAGLVLFGKSSSLRRIFPIATRIDYIMIEGRDWVPDPDRRYHSIEIRESLLTGIPRLLQQIMTDIPQAFALDSDEIFRKDNPIIPRKAIREGVCNALMHRDYTINSPVQIRRYSNRIEFENAGYSLKPEDQLGLPGSITRNDTIATILHEVNLAETKGTGIRAMRDSMQGANLTIPLIESDRSSNQFRLTFLTHHLFDKRDIGWLGKFKNCSSNDEEARALIVIREMGVITKVDFRIINTVDTLSASNSLRKLRDLGFLEQKGRGASTYYIPTKRMLTPIEAPDISEGTRHISEDEILKIPSGLKKKLNKLTGIPPSPSFPLPSDDLLNISGESSPLIISYLGRKGKSSEKVV